MNRDALIEKIESLPFPAQKQAEAFVDFLKKSSKSKPRSHKKRRFKFDWAGGLADLKDDFTAVELQHRINEWR